MKEKLRLLIREQISKLFEKFGSEYLNYNNNSFSSSNNPPNDGEDDFEPFEPYKDIPDMQPGGKAHKHFLKDLGNDKSMTLPYKDPSKKEFDNMVQGLKQGNLDLPNDYGLVKHAEKSLNRQLNPSDKDKAQIIKNKMEKLAGAGSYN